MFQLPLAAQPPLKKVDVTAIHVATNAEIVVQEMIAVIAAHVAIVLRAVIVRRVQKAKVVVTVKNAEIVRVVATVAPVLIVQKVEIVQIAKPHKSAPNA